MPSVGNSNENGEHRKLCHSQSGGVLSVLAALCSILPLSGVYEILENISYEFDNGVVKDVYNIRPMTLEEKTAKQNAMKASFPNYEENGFVFNEELCEIEPILKLGVTRV